MSDDHESADLIISGARVWTGDDQVASAFAVRDGRIVAVGDANAVDAHRGHCTDVRGVGGAFVMPGFFDVHNHHVLAGRSALYELQVAPTASLDEVVEAVARHAESSAPDAWIVGGAWGSDLAASLARADALRALDKAAAGRPVVLSDDSRHNRWVSSAALDAAGIDAGSPDPPGGSYVRDSLSGEPTGLLLEAAANVVDDLAKTALPSSADALRRSAKYGLDKLASYGVTGLQDAGVSVDILTTLAALDDAGELDAWVVSSMLVNDPVLGLGVTGRELLDAGGAYRRRHHRPDFVKIFLDGVPPTRTAAFLEPYLPERDDDRPHFGTTLMSADEVAGWLREAESRGLSAKVHCTGDAAVRVLLDAVETVRRSGHGLRVQLAHGQFIDDRDLDRLAELEVIADISPYIWMPGIIPDAISSVLPAHRAARMQPTRTLLDRGVLVAAGSDWPVSEVPNPWVGIHGLVTRRDPTRWREGALWEEQAVDLDEALRIFTLNAAMAAGMGDVTGSITPGKSADFVVLDRDPFANPADALVETQVIETWFAGRHIWSSQTSA